VAARGLRQAKCWLRPDSAVFDGKTHDLQAFACIHVQNGGGTPQNPIPPPYFIEDLRNPAESLRDRRRRMR
jgi:hypothetical protein